MIIELTSQISYSNVIKSLGYFCYYDYTRGDTIYDAHYHILKTSRGIELHIYNFIHNPDHNKSPMRLEGPIYASLEHFLKKYEEMKSKDNLYFDNVDSDLIKDIRSELVKEKI